MAEPAKGEPPPPYAEVGTPNPSIYPTQWFWTLGTAGPPPPYQTQVGGIYPSSVDLPGLAPVSSAPGSFCPPNASYCVHQPAVVHVNEGASAKQQLDDKWRNVSP